MRRTQPHLSRDTTHDWKEIQLVVRISAQAFSIFPARK